MNAKTMKLKYVLTAILICLIGGNVWGEETWKLVKTTDQLENGDYLLASSDGTAIFNGEVSKGHGQTVSVTSTNGVIDNENLPEKACILTLTSQGNNTYTISNNGKYIGASKASSGGFTFTENIFIWNFSGSNGFEVSGTISGSKVYLRDYNHNSFRTYGSTNGNTVCLYKKEVSSSTLPAPTFNFDKESISINLGESFTAPKLTNGSDGIPIYKSSNTQVATVNQTTGDIQVISTGTTTITASVAETATYVAATASYTLTVIDPNNQTIILDFAKDDWGFPSDNGNGSATFNNLTCTFKIGKKPDSSNYLYIGKGGELTLPIFTDKVVTSIKLTTSGSIGNSVIISLYAGANVIVSDKSIGTKNETFTFDIPANSQGANIAYKFTPTTGNMQTIKIEMDCKQIESSSTIDEATNSMLLTGAWTAEQLAALDLSKINSLDMTSISIPEGVTLNTDSNPNCLVYISYDDMAKAEALPNAVIVDESGNIALDAIQLADGHDFHNKLAFSGDISYTRTFPTGWNTFALPFPATIADDDEIEEFDKIDENKVVFKKATTIAANTPYLINITAGKESKTFSATSIDVPVTASTGETYKSSFTKLTDNEIEGKYILVLENDKEVFAPATTNAALPAFRGYLELPQADGIRYSISHDKGGATSIDTNDSKGLSIYAENGALNIHSDETQTIHIRCIDGRTIRTIHLAEDTDAQIDGLDKGIYLINNQKVIIK